MFNFRILKKDKKTKARVGILKTPHGTIHTPNFVPVATKGALRGINFFDFKKIGGEVAFVNTFHFLINNAYKRVEKFGGLHKFLSCDIPLMTDSGGFQVFSLGFGMEHGVGKIANIFPEEGKTQNLKRKTNKSLIKINNKGIIFFSPIDGKKHHLTPELSIKIQKILGADFIFCFDECTSPLSSYDYTKEALARTHFWAEICLKEFGKKKNQALFGIVQGGEWRDLREESARFISSLPFFGIAIGGSLGKSKKDMHNILDWTVPLLPSQKPRHLLGIGEVEDIFEGVERGVDLFDCVIPTRLARRGVALTLNKKIDLRKSKFLIDKRPIDKNCNCFVCKNYSRAYLSHLVREKEINSINFLVHHNLFFIINLMKKIRMSILKGNFEAFKNQCLNTKKHTKKQKRSF